MKLKCNLCGSADNKELYVIEKEGKFRIVKCKKCGLVYQNPRPSKSEIHNMYNEDYFKGKGFDKGVNYVEGLKYKDAWDNIQNDRISTIEKYLSKGKFKKILDVGCGFGELLDVAKKRGWDAYGVELSAYSVRIARKFMIKVKTGKLKDAKYSTSNFDAITMIEVIEHLEDPLLTLKECRRILKKDGIIVIQTGDINGLYAKIKGKSWPYFLTGHLTYFSKRTLSQMLEKAGFKVEHVYNGDEISLRAYSKMFWHTRRKKFIYIPEFLISIAKFILRKSGAGGMTVYARK